MRRRQEQSIEIQQMRYFEEQQQKVSKIFHPKNFSHKNHNLILLIR